MLPFFCALSFLQAIDFYCALSFTFCFLILSVCLFTQLLVPVYESCFSVVTLFCLFADSQTWSEPPVRGTPPTPRDSHTCTAVGDNLFVFGGTDGLKPLRDLHILDTCKFVWK